MRFVAVRWTTGDRIEAATAVRFRNERPPGWRVVTDSPGFFMAVSGEPARYGVTALLANGRGVIVGQLFDRAATDAGEVAPADPAIWRETEVPELAQRLVARVWGAYVVILLDQFDPTKLTILRDPLGALDCVTWQVGGARIISSSASYAAEIVSPGAGIAWKTVAQQLVAPVQASEAIALDGVAAVEPGSICRITKGEVRQEPFWRPADLAIPAAKPQLPSPAELAAAVDACVAAWAAGYRRPIAELSGGLDSAIVASALRRCQPQAGDWLTYYASAAEGDERSFARATATTLALPLTEVARSTAPISAADLAALSTGFRPGVSGMDVHHDRDLAARADRLGADAIFTGQGGDAVFFQAPTALVAADALDQSNRLLAFARATRAAAVWTRATVWSVAGKALSRCQPPLPRPAPFVRAGTVDHHPWLGRSEVLRPAKQLQLFGLANSRVYFVDSLRSRRCDVVHPLLSQPLVELVLATPVIHLTGGDRDRRLAREAFRNRLPAVVIDRHGKGDLTSYYGRLVARSAEMLRRHMCDGHLAAAGLIDRDRLAAMLDPDRLAATDVYTEILTAALIESWLRRWSSR